jgi:N-acetyl-gamma-glutamyl-phosphate reductase
MKVGIIGSTGYAGQQLTALLINHKEVEIDFMMSNSQVGTDFSDIYGRFAPFLKGKRENVLIGSDEMLERIKSCQAVFLALPHGQSENYIRKFKDEMKLDDLVVIDLGSDFRYKNQELKPVYGLTEINRENIAKSNLIANPGCYPTAAALAIIPLLKEEGMIMDGFPIVIDAKSGMSGAGKNLNTGSLFCEVFGNSYPYKIGVHQHTDEIENSLNEFSLFEKNDNVVQFTPNIIPVNRGIIENIYIKPGKEVSEEALVDLYEAFYKDEVFVEVLRDNLPNIAKVANTNNCQIAVKYDQRTGMIVVVSAIDNLIKGAAGQAVQNFNVRFGFDEMTGLMYSPAHL